MPRALPLSCLLIPLFFAGGLFASRDSDWFRRWEALNGERIESELVEVWGPWAFFQDRDRFGAIAVNSFTPADQERMAAFEQLQQRDRGRPWRTSSSPFWEELKDQSFVIEKGKRVPFIPPDEAEPDFYVLYFGAEWCGPCKRFVPQLNAWYRQMRNAGFDNFALFFVSWDRNTREQQDYYQASGMPFPFLRLGLDKRLRAVRPFRPQGIPSLLVFDRDGHLLYHTYRGDAYRGPVAVLGELEQLLYLSQPDNPTSISALLQMVLAKVRENRPWGDDSEPRKYQASLPRDFLAELPPDGCKVVLGILSNGRVKLVKASPELSPDQRARLAEAVESWAYIPAMRDGQFVYTELQMRLGPVEAP